MGGLRRYMPRTWLTFLVATIAIAGIPPLAGFFSKDEILASAFLKRFQTLSPPWNYVPLLLWILAVLAATFTAFYMFRLYYMTFEGNYRGATGGGAEASEPAHAGHDVIPDHAHLDSHGAPALSHSHGHGTPHESPLSMTGVLMVLALLAVVGGLVGPPLAAFGGHGANAFQRWLSPVLLPLGGEKYEFPHASLATDWILILISIGVAVLGIMVARRFYGTDLSWSIPKRFVARFPLIHRLVENKYYVDEFYQLVVVGGTLLFSRALSWIDVHIVDGLVNLVRHITVIVLGFGSNLFDKYVIDGAVNGVAYTARGGSGLLRRMQSGLVQNYALIMGGGIVLLAAMYLVMKP